MIYLLGVFLLLILLSQYLILFITYKYLFPNKVTVEESLKIQISSGETDEKKFYELKKNQFELGNENGEKLTGFYIKGKSKKTIIFCHGVSWTRNGMLKYIDEFLKEGWNIFLYDHRGCGNSYAALPSYGYYEKKDLDSIYKFAKEIFPKSNYFALFGESMGGSTVLQYSELNKDFKFIVAICPFSNLKKLISFHLSTIKLPKFTYFYFLFFFRIYFYILGKFDLNKIDPEGSIYKNQIPLFLAHGTRDSLIPYFMSKEIFEKRKILSKTEFFSGENSEHTPYIYLEHKTEIEKKIWRFIHEIN